MSISRGLYETTICMILGNVAILSPIRKGKRLHTRHGKGSTTHYSAIIHYVTAQCPEIHYTQAICHGQV